MSNHTERPWTIEPHGDGYALYFGRTDRAHGMNVVHLVEPDWNWEVTKRKIETALNCHDELLAACKAATDFVESNIDACSITLWESLVDQCKSAIAKAEGK